MNFFAKLVSWIFHPLLMVTYLFLIVGRLSPALLSPLPIESIPTIIILIFILTFVLPALNIGWFKIFGFIASLQMPERRQRIFPFAFITLIYGVIVWMTWRHFRVIPADPVLGILLTSLLLVLLCTAATFFIKVSVHAAGICGVAGMLFFFQQKTDLPQLYYAMVISVFIAGAVISSRLHLRAHTPSETTTGAVLGLFTGYFSLLYFSLL